MSTALLLEREPGLRPEQMKRLITTTARPFNPLNYHQVRACAALGQLAIATFVTENGGVSGRLSYCIYLCLPTTD